MAFSHAIEHALRVALEAHHGQFRKGPGRVPYAVHPLHTAMMLARLGEPELVIQAALLHDVVEDSADWTHERLVDEFGADVAAVVEQVTEDKSVAWTERKRWAVDSVPGMCPAALAVKAADKLHNLESMAVELRASSRHEEVWAKFNGGRAETLRMARQLVDALAPRVSEGLGRALLAAVHDVERLAAGAASARE